MKIINDLPPHFNKDCHEEIIVSKIRSCIESKQPFRIAVFSANRRNARFLFRAVQDELRFPEVDVRNLKLKDKNDNYVVFLFKGNEEKLRGTYISDALLYEDLYTHLSFEEQMEIIRVEKSRIR